MGKITAAYIEEFGGSPADLPELCRAAQAAGMRVRTRVYDDDALTVFDPDRYPTPAERAALHREQDERRRGARHEVRQHQQQDLEQVRPVRHLRPLL